MVQFYTRLGRPEKKCDKCPEKCDENELPIHLCWAAAIKAGLTDQKTIFTFAAAIDHLYSK